MHKTVCSEQSVSLLWRKFKVYRCWLQSRNTSLESSCCDSLDLPHLITSPARLNTRSLAAELAGAGKSLRASGIRPLKRVSLNTFSPLDWRSPSELNKSNCRDRSVMVSWFDTGLYGTTTTVLRHTVRTPHKTSPPSSVWKFAVLCVQPMQLHCQHHFCEVSGVCGHQMCEKCSASPFC